MISNNQEKCLKLTWTNFVCRTLTADMIIALSNSPWAEWHFPSGMCEIHLCVQVHGHWVQLLYGDSIPTVPYPLGTLTSTGSPRVVDTPSVEALPVLGCRYMYIHENTFRSYICLTRARYTTIKEHFRSPNGVGCSLRQMRTGFLLTKAELWLTKPHPVSYVIFYLCVIFAKVSWTHIRKH